MGGALRPRGHGARLAHRAGAAAAGDLGDARWSSRSWRGRTSRSGRRFSSRSRRWTPARVSLLEQLAGKGARLLVPLRTRDQLHAVLALGPKRSEEEFGRDDLQLVRTLANQGAVAIENARLLRERAHQLELEKELEIARRVQFSLIPRELPSPRRMAGGGALRPGASGGWRLLRRDRRRAATARWPWWSATSRASRWPGAMLMVAAREVLHTAALGGARRSRFSRSPISASTRPSTGCSSRSPTSCCAPRGPGVYALAGQPAPLLRRSTGEVAELPAPRNRLPVGALKDARWDVMPFAARPGDLLLLYSDGLTDARAADGEAFGDERLARILAESGGDPQMRGGRGDARRGRLQRRERTVRRHHPRGGPVDGRREMTASTREGWRRARLETILDLSLALAGPRREGEVVEELVQRAVGLLDARAGIAVSLVPPLEPATVVSGRVAGGAGQRGTPGGGAVAAGGARRRRGADRRARRWASPSRRCWPRRVCGERSSWAWSRSRTRRRGRGGPDSTTRTSRSSVRWRCWPRRPSRRGACSKRPSAGACCSRRRTGRCGWGPATKPGSSARPPPSAGFSSSRGVWRSADVTVLIRGESGTGKERLARLLHSLSARQKGPFVPLNCAAVPETLLEAELFGIEKGVATGVTARPGKFELAIGGTLFLDEIGDLTPVLQAKLLRVVQEREVERVGGRQRIRVDVRLVTATNRDLEGMLGKGEFRQDLYYRLRVVELTLPPLRERHEDIPLLAQHFVRLHGRRMGREALHLARGALELLLRHDFPGNVRELENLLEAAAALASGDRVDAEDVRLAMGAGRAPAGGQAGTLDEVVRTHVAQTLERTGGNRAAAARALGIDRTTLYRMLMRWNATDDALRSTAKNDGPARTSAEEDASVNPAWCCFVQHVVPGRMPGEFTYHIDWTVVEHHGRRIALSGGHGAAPLDPPARRSVPGAARQTVGGGGRRGGRWRCRSCSCDRSGSPARMAAALGPSGAVIRREGRLANG